MVEVSCIIVHPRFIPGSQHCVIRLFRRGCNIIAQWHSFFSSERNTCMLSVPRYHKTINQENTAYSVSARVTWLYRTVIFPARVQVHLISMVAQMTPCSHCNMSKLLDKSHNAHQRHGPSDTCPCVIATRVLLELDWLWM